MSCSLHMECAASWNQSMALVEITFFQCLPNDMQELHRILASWNINILGWHASPLSVNLFSFNINFMQSNPFLRDTRWVQIFGPNPWSNLRLRPEIWGFDNFIPTSNNYMLCNDPNCEEKFSSIFMKEEIIQGFNCI